MVKKMRTQFTRTCTYCIILVATILSGCQGYSPAIKDVLDLAGDNRQELVEVLEFYQRVDKDSLKHQAAQFLIGNMQDKMSVRYRYIDDNNHDQTATILSQTNIKGVEEVIEMYNLRKVPVAKMMDCQVLSADYLKRHINHAFMVWRQQPWGSSIGFDDFCEYILPYRIGSETIEHWQQQLYEEYSHVVDTMPVSHSMKRRFNRFNRQLLKEYSYDVRSGLLSPDQSLSEMRRFKVGACEDICALTCFGMRALGVPVSIDVIPLWSNMNSGHTEVALLDEDGRFMTLMASIKSSYKAPKVFRRRYSMNTNNSALPLGYRKALPGLINTLYFDDVTDEYVDVADVHLIINQELHPATQYAFISVFNKGAWQPVYWSKMDALKQVCFPKMGCDQLYLVQVFENGCLYPVMKPFLLKSDGSLSIINGKKGLGKELVLRATQPSFENGRLKLHYPLEVGKEYQLFLWNGREWKVLESAIVVPDSVSFDNIKMNHLYRLVEKGEGKKERPFVFSSSGVEWY